MGTVNLYCDESCHLEKDKSPVMTLGSLLCPIIHVKDVSAKIRDIKLRHGISSHREIKWVKVSPGQLDYYLDLVDLFMSDDKLRFRAIVADKTNLNHDAFEQEHDDWYYKMYYLLLRNYASELSATGIPMHVYLDVKDTRSAYKTEKLRRILREAHLDGDDGVIPKIQLIRSHESSLMQLADLFIGAVSYKNRRLAESPAKLEIISTIEQAIGRALDRNSPYSERKFNVFHWEGRTT